MKLLLLSCVMSMVLAVANADDDSDSSSGDSSEENPRQHSFQPVLPLFRRLLRRSRAVRHYYA